MQYTKIIFADCENHMQHIRKLLEKISVFECKNRQCTKLPLRVKRLVKYVREGNRLKVNMWIKKPTGCHLVLYLFLLISCSL